MILVIGKNYSPYGRLGAVRSIEGERYYFFIKRNGDVAMIPAVCAEKQFGSK